MYSLPKSICLLICKTGQQLLPPHRTAGNISNAPWPSNHNCIAPLVSGPLYVWKMFSLAPSLKTESLFIFLGKGLPSSYHIPSDIARWYLFSGFTASVSPSITAMIGLMSHVSRVVHMHCTSCVTLKLAYKNVCSQDVTYGMCCNI